MTQKHHVDAFIKATVECFESMVDVVPETKSVLESVPPIQQSDICALIGLSGDSVGMVSLAFDKPTALKVVAEFLGEEPEDLEQEDIYDAAGELINIIAGNGKAYVEDIALTISLPSVMYGEKYYMSVPKNTSVVTVEFDLPDVGSMTMMLSLVD